MSVALAELLKPKRLTEVVDIGANPIDGDPPYAAMLQQKVCNVTGFEPQPEALKELNRRKGRNERYLPHAVGDGGTHRLHVCNGSGMTSLFEPEMRYIKMFEPLETLSQVVETVDIATKRLDDINDISLMDMLKIDIQGGELAVFQNGRAKLAKTGVIQVEVSFVPLYKNQPSLGDVDVELRAQGFLPHCFAALKQWGVHNMPDLPPSRQLLEADLVYVRDISKPEAMDEEDIKHIMMILHYCYGSHDVVLRLAAHLERRTPKACQNLVQRYVATQLGLNG